METTSNFIEDIIDKEIQEGKHKTIITRFPPEPNGYLHIGHAKALCINFGVKAKYNGKCNLRFDDTNPSKEDVEYVNSIKEDIKWLGFQWDKELYASDYFDQMYKLACKLIKDGKAYVCDLSSDEIKNTRGTFEVPGVESPYRNRTVKENLKLFKEMKEGKYADGEKVLRAKIDMSSPNINMRDPVIYRIVRATHHRTGDKWVIYPMYDFAHPLEDAIEGITHSLCSLEFENHRPLYDWVVENTGFKKRPRQIEFARLNLDNTVMSKRFLKRLVDEGVVWGWNDPRMSTLSGLRERGYPASAIRDFCGRIGVAKADSKVSIQLLEHCVREELNRTATRVMAVLDPLKVIIDNYDKVETVKIENNPQDKEAGEHETKFTKEIYIEREDFSTNPPPKYYRLKKDGNVRLKGAYVVEYASHKEDKDGNVIEVHVNLIEGTKSGEEGSNIKVKGTIHWVSVKYCVDIKVNEFGYLINEAEGDYMDRVNKDSLKVLSAKGEEFLKTAKKGDRFQFMRKGYYVLREGLEFNSIVSLKDGFK